MLENEYHNNNICKQFIFLNSKACNFSREALYMSCKIYTIMQRTKILLSLVKQIAFENVFVTITAQKQLL